MKAPVTDPKNQSQRPQPEPKPSRDAELEFAASVLRAEAAALERAAAGLDRDHFARAVGFIEKCAADGGTVLVSGLGKSGLVGAKIAATLSSLGVPAHAVHPTEAAHGDLGRFRKTDVAVCLSHSGETEEVVQLAALLRADGLPIIAITRGRTDGDDRPESTLERLSDAVLAELVDEEASRHATDEALLAPTSSTTAAMAIGDALALAVARRNAFTSADFAARHPGGQLGGLLRPVTELLRFKAGKRLPTVAAETTVADALHATDGIGRRPGALLITDQTSGALLGIFTDGDLRRLVANNPGDLARPIGDVMTPAPRTLPETALARDAVLLARQHRADEIPVVDRDGKPIGLLDVQDLVAMKLVQGD